MYLAFDATAVPALAPTGSSSATTMELFPEGEVNILADEACFADALNAVVRSTAAQRGQARGDVTRHEGTF